MSANLKSAYWFLLGMLVAGLLLAPSTAQARQQAMLMAGSISGVITVVAVDANGNMSSLAH